MTQYRLGEIEAKFAALIWDNEPLTSGLSLIHILSALPEPTS